MTPPPPEVSDATIERYLLGALRDDEAEQLDQRAVADPAFAARVEAIQHDLADAYARHELPPDDATRWEQLHLASPQGRAELQLAQALAERERQKRPARTRPTWRPVFAAAAALVILLAGTYLVMRTARPAEAPVTSRIEATPPRAPAPAAPSNVPPPSGTAAAPPQPSVVAMTLMPATRSIAEWPRLLVPKGTSSVRLTLFLEPSRFSRFDIVMRRTDSHVTVWTARGVAAEAARGGRTVSVSVPAASLSSGRYVIEVSGVSAGAHEVIGTYPVAAVLQ